MLPRLSAEESTLTVTRIAVGAGRGTPAQRVAQVEAWSAAVENRPAVVGRVGGLPTGPLEGLGGERVVGTESVQ